RGCCTGGESGPRNKLAVVPAKAGTHNAKCSLSRKGDCHIAFIEGSRGMGPGLRRGDSLSVAAIFPEQIQLLLHRAVRETEQHRILIRLVRDPAPARHHEQIAGTPLKRLVADL